VGRKRRDRKHSAQKTKFKTRLRGKLRNRYPVPDPKKK
jgi:hypothetical protein